MTTLPQRDSSIFSNVNTLAAGIIKYARILVRTHFDCIEISHNPNRKHPKNGMLLLVDFEITQRKFTENVPGK